MNSPEAIALDFWVLDVLQVLPELDLVELPALTTAHNQLQQQVLARIGWELLLRLQGAGMMIAPDQYDQLREALSCGFGHQGWPSLKRLCRLLWVKPCPTFDAARFEQVAEKFRQDHPATLLISETAQDSSSSNPGSEFGHLPTIPPRRQRSHPSSPPTQIPAAIEGQVIAPEGTNKPFPSSSPQRFCLTPQRFPVSKQDVQVMWKQLRQQSPQYSQHYELDLEATISRYLEEGALTDVILKPEHRNRTQLLVLVDDENLMIPYQAAFQPLIQTITQQRYPSQIFRFNVFPSEYLFPYPVPGHRQAVSEVLSRLHRHQTIAMIWSDAGAILRSGDSAQIEGMRRFLIRLAPCVRQIIWLNPLPEERWRESDAAWAIAKLLNGQMYCYEAKALASIAHQPQVEVKLHL